MLNMNKETRAAFKLHSSAVEEGWKMTNEQDGEWAEEEQERRRHLDTGLVEVKDSSHNHLKGTLMCQPT